ncbi:MAG TPA: thioredoxin domain-containing protein [Dehalococcoidia bacterium]|nr:thioredoxin domain-containing protein [Dehalococcoidia bacterium]
MPNRLANETSPYLLQHKDNPVDWYAWGEEAFAAAREADRPILLSVGYSACHWCHVMAHESFEDEAIAAQMNRLFVNIKVDREERPDVDNIYMQAVQSLTGRGGWPMTVFLTPEGLPFYGGTYFPPADRQGMPGFPRLLEAVADAYKSKRQDVLQAGAQLVQAIASPARLQSGDTLLTPELLDDAAQATLQAHDDDFGGFGSAPKFPQAMSLDFLMRWYRRSKSPSALEALHKTLRAMAQGGMYDQVGGGFHRYSTDAVWLVPHFEKMLYDNALLARLYLDAWKLTGDPFYRRITEETLDYVLREMTDASGAFYSTQDADSEGEEGKFFLWTPAELEAVLGEDGALVGAYFGVTAEGNFEDSNILHVRVPPERFVDGAATTAPGDPLALWERVRERATNASSEAAFETFIKAAKSRLYAAREHRVHPGRDEKVLTAWNGLMLRAFAEAAIAFDSQPYRDAAAANAGFLLREMRPATRLLRTWKDGIARLNGYLEDYACLIDGLIATHAATFDERYLRSASQLAAEMIDLFWDDDIDGFFDTGRDHETLITRPRDFFDNATPSGTSVAVDVLLKLALLTDNADYERRASTCLRTLAPYIENAPTAFGRLLAALDFHLSTPQELAIVLPSETSISPSPRKERGQGGEVNPIAAPASRLVALLDQVRALYAPNLLIVGGPSGQTDNPTPLLDDREALNGLPTAYLCERYVCQAPTTDPAQLQAQLTAALS